MADPRSRRSATALPRLSYSAFALSTIAVAEIFRLIAINERWLTGGASGDGA